MMGLVEDFRSGKTVLHPDVRRKIIFRCAGYRQRRKPGWEDKLQVHQRPAEVDEFLRWLEERNVRSYVEIGTASGGMLHLVDSWLRAKFDGVKTHGVDIKNVMLHRQLAHPDCTFELADGPHAYTPNKPVDVIFSDNNMRHKNTRKLIKRLRPHTRYFALHDIFDPRRLWGANYYWHNTMNPELKVKTIHHHGPGIGIMRGGHRHARFCEIGMPRTASRSLAMAMKKLGYTVSHGTGYLKNMPQGDAEKLRYTCLQDVLWGKVPIYPYTNYDFVGNLPIIHWQKLAETRPEMKFILTLRPIDDWWAGCYRQWSKIRRWKTRMFLRNGLTKRDDGVSRDFISFVMIVGLFGCYGMDEFAWKTKFKRHADDVIKYFEGTDRLLVHNAFEGDSWPELCEFLGRRDAPTDEWPKSRSMSLTTSPEDLR